jgi:hypothetical protein
MRRNVVFSVVLAVLITSLMCSGVSAQPGEVEKTAKQSESSEQPMNGIRLKPFRYIDEKGTGIEAFSMLIPVGWKFDGGIRWLLDNPGMPAYAAFRVSDPGRTQEFEVFPNQAFFWTTNQMLLSTFPIGSRYFGSEVRPIIPPIEALRQIVIPRFRQNVTKLKIVNSQPLPELAQALGAGGGSQPGVSVGAEAAKIKIEYDLQGRAIEEEIYCVVETVTFPIQTMYGMTYNTNWYVDYIFSFKSDKGKFEDACKRLQTIASSFRLNLKWFNKYCQVVEYLIKSQIQHIQSIGQLSRIIAQTSDEIRNENLQSYQHRQAVNDKIVDNFCRYIRGVEQYYDPIKEQPVELPSGYNNAWTNSLGEYIVTEDLSYNPNIGSNINWQKIERTK